ncbi:SIS domain-containing protein [Kaistia dalseonensis]|uniref:Glucosamine--fructose-6-phosphate aminotransferase (Isomerizing) n=1 Tax=Kaistia dalseonensis TaxID=410840 RepID=A0ABU0HBY4_9HYPH|nr:SIS domain-containing protein [Kaistia dalseonensis]MCX5497189.1 SIS domain-containing protein [Kaistia dalseonensis]MDQ0439820.1 glucosamine--fructose-6-phosphate aminotransferase (isomerizing) [Kaistia dalseonensis]
MTTTLMRAEIDEAPAAVRRLLDQSGDAIAEAGARLRALDPKVFVTVARGSSDHAATFFKYACEIVAGVPVASLGPSIASIYHAPLRLQGAAALAISQSGKSPDILALMEAVKAAGATSFSLVNVEDAPLAGLADSFIPLRAGPERSVAATKSYIAGVVASIAILAAWREDKALQAAIAALPDRLEEALACDWSPALEAFVKATSLYTIGRGPGFAIALEAALKFKETAILHAEAYSGAELQHGPVSLVDEFFPLLAFIPNDAAAPSLIAMVSALHARGAQVFTATAADVPGVKLPIAPTGHAITDPISIGLSFYRFVEQVSVARGYNPDQPRHLKKVTETV